MPRSVILLLLILFCPGLVYSQSGPPAAIFQSWNEVEITVPLIKTEDAAGNKVDRLAAIFNGILRTGRVSHAEDKRGGFGLSLRINKHLSLYSALIYRHEEVVKYLPHVEKRLDAGATFSTTWKKFSIRDRNMYEHRYRNGRVDTDFYRQRLQVSHQVTHKGKTLFSPFVSEEVYYQLHLGRWVQSEFYAGISRRLNKHSVFEISYIRNDVIPVNTNGLSLTLRIHL